MKAGYDFNVPSSAIDLLGIQEHIHSCAVGMNHCIVLKGAEDFIGEFLWFAVASLPGSKEPYIVVAIRDFSFGREFKPAFLCCERSYDINWYWEQCEDKNHRHQDFAIEPGDKQVKSGPAYDSTKTIKRYEECISIRDCISKGKYEEEN